MSMCTAGCISLNWVYPFFRDNFSSDAYIVSKELNQDPELFKSFRKMSTARVSLLAELNRTPRTKDTNFPTVVSADETLLITLRQRIFIYWLLQI